MSALTCVRPAAGGRPWVFLPFAGGNGDWYRTWADHLPPGDGLWVADLPGRARRSLEHPEPDPRRVDTELVVDLDGVPDSPVLFGHSLGGMLAHAVAHAVEEAGRDVAAVVVSGARPPDGTLEVTDLSDAALVDQLVEHGGTPPEVLAHPELLDIVLPALRADLRLAGALPVPGTVRAPLLAFAGDDDVSAPPEEVARWADHTTSWWGMTVMPGGHFFVADHITAVVDAVSRGLGTGGSGYDEELLRT